MMKNILGLDLGTNSIGWALIRQDFQNRQGEILGMGSRIIPMSQDILGEFGKGNSVSQTAVRTGYRGGKKIAGKIFTAKRETSQSFACSPFFTSALCLANRF